jgi:hypothetical protein
LPKSYDPQPFHVDDEARPRHRRSAADRERLAHLFGDDGHAGAQCVCGSTSMGSPGIDEHPLAQAGARRRHDPHDECGSVDKRVSESKPDRGIVSTEWEASISTVRTVITVRFERPSSACVIREPPHEARHRRTRCGRHCVRWWAASRSSASGWKWISASVNRFAEPPAIISGSTSIPKERGANRRLADRLRMVF